MDSVCGRDGAQKSNQAEEKLQSFLEVLNQNRSLREERKSGEVVVRRS